MSKNMKLSVGLGAELMSQLDAYGKLVNKNRTEVIKNLVSKLPQEASTLDTSLSIQESNNLLNDSLFQERLLRFLLIIKDQPVNSKLQKEAYKLWQNLHQSLK